MATRTVRFGHRAVAAGVLAVVAVGGGVAYGAVSYVDPCANLFVRSNPSHTESQAYERCRFDSIEGKLDALAQPPVTVTADPVTATVTVTGPDSTTTVTQTVTAPPVTTVTAPPVTTTVTPPPQTVTVTASPTSATVTSATTTATPTSSTTTPAGLKRVPVDGGTSFYSRFASPLNYTANTFPIGVWFESVSGQGDIDTDKAAGLNTYVELTDNSNVTALAGSGMNVLTDNLSTLGAKKNGHLLYDEADMQYGPGAGYDFMAQRAAAAPTDGKIRYANYGKGVVFWELDAEAARFLNGYQDFTSTDVYWYTDSDVCIASQGGYLLGVNRALTAAECRRASNYGAQVEKVRRLAGYDTPIWSYVELGKPGTTGTLTITAAQIRAAVWSSLIHGARGIVYFNHSFSGACQSQHILRDPCYAGVRQEVTALNAQIQALAPALNSDSIVGIATASSTVDQVTKFADGKLYVFAGAKTAAGGQATFSLPCVGDATVTVLNEGRTLTAAGGSFTDSFANGEAYHLYRVDGGSTCGL